MLVAFCGGYQPAYGYVCDPQALPACGRTGCSLEPWHRKILIVDDEVVVAEDIRRLLRSLGYTVVGVVSSGSDAVHQAGAHRPDLILMDVKLKGPIDGIDAARTIHAQYGIPVIYLTAFSDEDTLERARWTLPWRI